MLLPYFALLFLAALVLIAAFAWLGRDKREKATEDTPTQQEPQRIYYLKKPYVATLSFTGKLSDKDTETLQSWLVPNEDTRPLPASKHDDSLDSFDYEELWGEYNETVDQARKIDRWERQALEDAGEDWL